MSLEYFIAKRLFFKTEDQKQVSRPAVRIATMGIAVGLAVMLIAVSVVVGFKRQVETNIIGLSSHIQVTSYQSNYSYEMAAMELPEKLPEQLKAIPGVRHVQRFSTKPGIIKTPESFQTIVFKGFSPDFDWNFLQQYLLEGYLPELNDSLPSTQILLSDKMARRLKLKPGDKMLCYFTRDEQLYTRQWELCGIFDTHFAEFDKVFALVDDRQIVKLNNWDPGQAGGLEIFVDNIRELPQVESDVYNLLFKTGNLQGNSYMIQSVYDLNPDMFGWLDLLDMNVWLILLLMIFVSGFNMISGLLILILERTNLIGMLKAMGADNISVRKVFLYLSSFLIGKGMLWGNVLGLGLCLLQYFFRILKLDPEVYYIDAVPVELNLWYILLLNLGTLLASLLMVLGPSALVARISPVKAIRFD
ncbi:MAG: FtsX-like permease family protein [Bacteroidales bacterium]